MGLSFVPNGLMRPFVPSDFLSQLQKQSLQNANDGHHSISEYNCGRNPSTHEPSVWADGGEQLPISHGAKDIFRCDSSANVMPSAWPEVAKATKTPVLKASLDRPHSWHLSQTELKSGLQLSHFGNSTGFRYITGSCNGSGCGP